MALVACPECNHRVSSAAAACPSCGHPIGASPASNHAPHSAPPQTNGVPAGRPRKPRSAPGTWAIRFLGLVFTGVGVGLVYTCYADFKGQHTIWGWIWGALGVYLLFVPNPDPAEKDAQIICPHCGVRGHVRTRMVQRKKGIDGGKATGAILTGGVSLLATGLSRKELATEARCNNCGTIWHF